MNKKILRQFGKLKICMLLLGLLLAGGCGLAVFLTLKEATGFLILHTLSRVCFFFSLGWVCLCFSFTAHGENCGIREALDASGGIRIYENHAFRLLLLFFLLWNLLLVSILWAASAVNDPSGYFRQWFWLPYLCNLFLPLLICLLLTYLAASSRNILKGLLLLIGFLFLISPMAEGILWREKPGLPVDAVWNALRWPFTILYQNGSWAGNLQGGLQTEPARISVLLFWLLFCSCLLLQRTGAFGKKIFGTLAGGAALCCLIYSYLPASVFRLNDRWDGIQKLTWDLAQTPGDHRLETPEDPGFAVEAYDLQLFFGRELKVRGSMRISAEQPQKKFLFTLDDGYRVKSVLPETDGVSLEFYRQGNALLIAADQPLEKLQIEITYQGHHELFYAYAGAAMLPGWLPWYPMAGERQTAVSYSGQGEEYNPYNCIQEAEIRLEADMPLITNLENLGGQCYGGRADSITVLGGALADAEDPVVKNYLPLEYGREEFINKQKADYRQTLEDLARYGVDTSFLQDKELLFVSEEIGRTNCMAKVFLFQDYILASPNCIQADEIIYRLMLADIEHREIRENSTILRNLRGMLMGNWKNPEKVKESLEQVMNFHFSLEAEADREGDALGRLSGYFQKIDGEKLFSMLLDFGLHPETYGSDEGFLEALEKSLSDGAGHSQES